MSILWLKEEGVCRKICLLSLFLLLCLNPLSSSSFAWETMVKESPDGADWRSIYEGQAILDQQGTIPHLGNEHAELSAQALLEIGAGKLLTGRDLPIVVDLNASYFKRSLLEDKDSYAPVYTPEDGLERRLLPPPPQFSGLPDFSFTIYDWINKNALCPTVPPGADSRNSCHRFFGWLGALNSSHFGTQASLTYQHLHRLALSIAELTRDIRGSLSKDKDALEAYSDFVREGEWMALAYEGFAQHFLQDRWSSGHMWERWNSPDHEQLSDTRFFPNFAVAGISGIIHGWESFMHTTKIPYIEKRLAPQTFWVDPLCGPWIGTEYQENILQSSLRWWIKGETPRVELKEMEPVAYKHASQNKGAAVKFVIGDHFLKDMTDGKVGRRYGFINSLPLNVPFQQKEMMGCLKAGWAEVIRALGKNPEGGYGIQKIPLNKDAPSFKTLGYNCFDPYVNNQSMARAWPFSRPTFWSKLGRAMLEVGPYIVKTGKELMKLTPQRPVMIDLEQLSEQIVGKENVPTLRRLSKLMVRISVRLWESSKKNPEGLDMAEGGLGEIVLKPRKRTWLTEEKYTSILPGRDYQIASYLPPDDIYGFPYKDKNNWRGRDLETVYGFFSRAGAYFWCRKLPEILPQLRGGEDRKDQAVCEYLSDHVYQGTDPEYSGQQRERRTVDHSPQGKGLNSFCSLLGFKYSKDKKVPLYLPPGYVKRPYRRSASNLTYNSVENWCKKIPVFHLMPDKDKKNRDIVAVVKDEEGRFEIKGENLSKGEGKARVWIDCDKPDKKRELLITSLSDNTVSLKLPQELLSLKGLHQVCFERQDRVPSVGRFLIEIDIEKTPQKVVSMPEVSGCYKAGAPARVALEVYPEGKARIVLKESKRILPLGMEMERSQSELKPFFGKIPEDFKKTLIKITYQFEGRDDFRELLGRETFQVREKTFLEKEKKTCKIHEDSESKDLTLRCGNEEDLQWGQYDEYRIIPEKSSLTKWFNLVEDKAGIRHLLEACWENYSQLRTVSSNYPYCHNKREARIATDKGVFVFNEVDFIGVEDTDLVDFFDEHELSAYPSLIHGLNTQELKIISPQGDILSSPLAPGTLVQVRARGENHCPGIEEVMDGRLWLSGRQSTIWLKETDPDSGIYIGPEQPIKITYSKGAKLNVVVRGGMGYPLSFKIAAKPSQTQRAKKKLASTLKEKEKIKKRIQELEKAKQQYDSLRRQWKFLSDFIDKKRAEGRDVSDLMENLRRIADELKQARARYVELQQKYGTLEELRSKLK